MPEKELLPIPNQPGERLTGFDGGGSGQRDSSLYTSRLLLCTSVSKETPDHYQYHNPVF